MERLKSKLRIFLALILTMTGISATSVICHAEEITDKSDMIASDDERAPSSPVGEEGMIPVYGTDIKDGTYTVEAESSSSMFRIVEAELTVCEGNMTAVITLGGTGYIKLYMGTGEQAVEAREADYAVFVENSEGAYTFTIPVEALNQELECTGFSKRKEKWYDHQILFRADTIPQDALLKRIAPVEIDVDDGSYTIEADLAGGSGKASITSPVTISVAEKKGTASIEWSSPNYDYMIVNGEKYLPVNTEGNSVFEIPIWVLDEEMTVLADTTAMSIPHEIEYTLTFHADTLKKENNGFLVLILIIVVVCLIFAGLLVCRQSKKKKKAVNE